MTEHANLRTCLCVKTSTGAGFLLSALLFQHTRNCPFTSLSTCRIPVHSPTVSLYMQLLCPHYGTSCSVPFVAADATHPVLEGGSLVVAQHCGSSLAFRSRKTGGCKKIGQLEAPKGRKGEYYWSLKTSAESVGNLGPGHCFETTVHHLRWTARHAQEWHAVRVAAVPW